MQYGCRTAWLAIIHTASYRLPLFLPLLLSLSQLHEQSKLGYGMGLWNVNLGKAGIVVHVVACPGQVNLCP